MSDPYVAILMLCLFIFTIFLGFPIAFTLLALAFAFGWYAMGERIISLIGTNTADVLSNDVLVAVPLFLFMGYLVERANILDRLFMSIQRSPAASRARWPWRRWPPARCSPPRRASSAPS
jgi:TRAP-type mannitol/chloroaromatic compound transport system permease large subunit